MGIVASRSGAKKLASTSVDEIKIEINTNDILINKDGTIDNYKSFPDIGEVIKDNMLAARRRLNYQSILFDLSTSNLNRVNPLTDNIYYSKGMIVDIDVYCNADIEHIRDFPYNTQIMKYLDQNLEYCTDIHDTLLPYFESEEYTYTDDAAYLFKRARDTINPNITWKDENSDFDNLVIKFTIMDEKKIVTGSKITNRYGF